MLLILAILYLWQGSPKAKAIPITLSARQNILSDISGQSETAGVCQASRSLWDIVQSCLVTIFACSWVSVHPNMSGHEETRRKKILRGLELMFWSIFMPEFIILWATRQRYGACKLKEKYRDNGWTLTHGYFIQMGGFVLHDRRENIAKGVLLPERFEALLEQQKIEMPTITEEDIQDRSKADGLGKALVILQIFWFVVQVIARRLQGLVITPLELVTLAFAAFNAIMYYFWWNKPLNVESTVPVYLLESDSNETVEESTSSHHENGFENDLEDQLTSLSTDSVSSNVAPSTQHRHQCTFPVIFREIWWFSSGLLFRWPVNGIIKILNRFLEMTGPEFSSLVASEEVEDQMQVPIFYARGYDIHQVDLTTSVVPFIGTVFGAIHCSAWSFAFPTKTEAKIWRSFSVFITADQAIGILLSLINVAGRHTDISRKLVSVCRFLVTSAVVITVPLYMAGRLVLVVEAFLVLRYLPPGAYEVVTWTTFLPHI